MTEEMNYFDKTDERETISRNPNSVVALKDKIESLRAQFAEVKEELDRLKREDFSYERIQNDSLKIANNVLKRVLFTTQSKNKKMEEAIKWVLKIHSDPTLGHEAISMEWLNDLEDSLQTTKEKND